MAVSEHRRRNFRHDGMRRLRLSPALLPPRPEPCELVQTTRPMTANRPHRWRETKKRPRQTETGQTGDPMEAKDRKEAETVAAHENKTSMRQSEVGVTNRSWSAVKAPRYATAEQTRAGSQKKKPQLFEAIVHREPDELCWHWLLPCWTMIP